MNLHHRVPFDEPVTDEKTWLWDERARLLAAMSEMRRSAAKLEQENEQLRHKVRQLEREVEAKKGRWRR